METHKFFNTSQVINKWEKINSLRTGFEPVRVTPSDFESDALTTRPSQLRSLKSQTLILCLIKKIDHIILKKSKKDFISLWKFNQFNRTK